MNGIMLATSAEHASYPPIGATLWTQSSLAAADELICISAITTSPIRDYFHTGGFPALFTVARPVPVGV